MKQPENLYHVNFVLTSLCYVMNNEAIRKLDAAIIIIAMKCYLTTELQTVQALLTI
jgi:hypothetical protein